MGLSNKAINKFAKFTATKPPLYTYNRLAPSSGAKKGFRNVIPKQNSSMPNAKTASTESSGIDK